jgi:undecaprenyl-diphosphatase
MSLLESIIYGIVQGLTEFLPISSSAHLALLPRFLNFEDPGVIFDLSLHVGTALSIMLYFRKEVFNVLGDLYMLFKKRGRDASASELFSLNLVLATLMTVALALMIKDVAISYGRHLNLIAFNFIFFGILMAFADKFMGMLPEGAMEKLQVKRSLLIGAAQVISLFPGVSRSGATLTMARFCGLSRTEGTRFSFLLSLPLILGGMVLEYRTLLEENAPFDLSSVVMGSVVSFVVSLLAIHYFLKWVGKMGLWPFALYRVAFGIFLLTVY